MKVAQINKTMFIDLVTRPTDVWEFIEKGHVVLDQEGLTDFVNKSHDSGVPLGQIESSVSDLKKIVVNHYDGTESFVFVSTTISKAKKFPVGTVRKYNSQTLIKTESGWKPYGGSDSKSKQTGSERGGDQLPQGKQQSEQGEPPTETSRAIEDPKKLKLKLPSATEEHLRQYIADPNTSPENKKLAEQELAQREGVERSQGPVRDRREDVEEESEVEDMDPYNQDEGDASGASQQGDVGSNMSGEQALSEFGRDSNAYRKIAKEIASSNGVSMTQALSDPEIVAQIDADYVEQFDDHFNNDFVDVDLIQKYFDKAKETKIDKDLDEMEIYAVFVDSDKKAYKVYYFEETMVFLQNNSDIALSYTENKK